MKYPHNTHVNSNQLAMILFFKSEELEVLYECYNPRSKEAARGETKNKVVVGQDSLANHFSFRSFFQYAQTQVQLR